ncbi:PilZ domain-containing protein [Desulfolithobacter sp.]
MIAQKLEQVEPGQDSRKLDSGFAENRRAVRIPRQVVEQALLAEKGSIYVQVAGEEKNRWQDAVLRDLHQNGMSFVLLDHSLREGDLIHVELRLGGLEFESDARVRWTLRHHVGIEFLDPRARDASFLAEFYATRLLNLLREDLEDSDS